VNCDPHAATGMCIPCGATFTATTCFAGICMTSAKLSGNALAARVSFDFELRDCKDRSHRLDGSYTHDEPVRREGCAGSGSRIRPQHVENGLHEITASLKQYFVAQAHAAAQSR